MKNLLTLLVLLSVHSLYGQMSVFESIGAPSNATCGNPIVYKATIFNSGELPLVHTGMRIVIYNSASAIAYNDTVPGPDISPDNFHQFDITVPAGSLEFNGSYETKFYFLSENDMNLNPESIFFPLEMTFCAMSLEEAIEGMNFYISENIDIGPRQQGYIYPYKLDEGTRVASFLPEEFDQILTGGAYLGFVVSDMNAMYEQTCKYLIMNARFGFISEHDANWYPVIDGVQWNPNPFGELQLTPIDSPTTEAPLLVFETEMPPSDKKACAILVSGKDPNEFRLWASFIDDMNIMKEYLTKANAGPRLREDQVIIRHGISADSIRSEIEKLKEGYDEIYFYYYGHGSKQGKMCTGENPQEWLSYFDLVNALEETRAADIHLIIDCCYSGIAQNVVDGHSIKNWKNIEVLTGSNDMKPGTAAQYIEENQLGPAIVIHGAFSHNLLICGTDSLADQDMNGEVTLVEAGNWVLETNPVVPGKTAQGIVDLQCPQVNYHDFYAQTQQVVQDIIMNEYPIYFFDDCEIFLHNKVLWDPYSVHSFDHSYSKPIDQPTLFGWANWNASTDFSKEVSYFYYDPINGQIEFRDSIAFWPEIEGMDDFDPYDPDHLLYSNLYYSDLQPENHIYEEMEPQGDPKDSICAIVLSGRDSKKAYYEDRYKFNTEIFKGNLLRETYGPRLHEENVLVRHGISGDSIKSILSSMKDKYSKVYFYYAGHGSKTQICSGNSFSERLEYRELLVALNEIGARDYCIFLDCCWSGGIISEQKINNWINVPGANVGIFTSANSLKKSAGDYFVTEDQDSTGYSKFTYHFFKCFGDPEADKNDDQVTSFKESFDWFLQVNPSDLMGNKFIKIQCPSQYVKKVFRKNDNTTGDQVDREIDFGIRQRNRSTSSYRVDVINLVEAKNRIPGEAETYKISDFREWTVQGDLNPDSLQAFDFTFYLNEAQDSLKASEGVYGIVHKAPSDTLWQIYYPTTFDNQNQIVIAEDVQQANFDFALAKIEPVNTSTEKSGWIPDIRLFPNPAASRIQVQADGLREVTMMDGQGLILSHTKIQPQDNHNKMMHQINLTALKSGIYFLEVKTNEGRVVRQFIKM